MPAGIGHRRLLLAAHPPEARRRRLDELDDLLHATGRARLSAREATRLVAGGLRTRLGRPDSRTVLPASIVVALLAGVFGALLGYLAAWQTAPPLPDNDGLHRILRTAAPGRTNAVTVARDDFLFGWSRKRLSAADTLRRLARPDGADGYGPATASIQGWHTPAVSTRRYAGEAADRLAAAGWSTGRPVDRPLVQTCWSLHRDGDRSLRRGHDCTPDGGTRYVLDAERRGLTVRLSVRADGAPDTDDRRIELHLRCYRGTPRGALPAAAVGGLLAAALVWLVFGWASRRTEARGRAVRVAAPALCLGCVGVLLPVAYVVAAGLIDIAVATGDPRSPFRAARALAGMVGAPALWLAAAGTALALALLAVAASGTRTRRTDPEPATRPITVEPANVRDL